MTIGLADRTVGSQRPTVGTGQETARTDSCGTTGHRSRPDGRIPMRPFTFLFRGLVAFALLAPVSIITTLPVSAATTIARDHDVQQRCRQYGRPWPDLPGHRRQHDHRQRRIRDCHGPRVPRRRRRPDGGLLDQDDLSDQAGHRGHAVQQLDQRRRRHAPLQRHGHNNFYGVSPGASASPAATGATTAATVNQCVGSGASGIVPDDRLRSLPGHDERRGDHAVQRLGHWRDAGRPDLHRDRHDGLGPRGQDQPVQRLGQRRWSPGHLLRQPGQQRGHQRHTAAHRHRQR